MRPYGFKLGWNRQDIVNELGKGYSELIELHHRITVQKCEEYFKHPFNDLVANPALVDAFAKDVDPNRRGLVLIFLTDLAPSPPDICDRLMWFAVSDPAADVRQAAIVCLGHVHKSIGAPHILKFLGNIVRNNDEDAIVRKTAYFTIAGYFTRQGRFLNIDEFKVPADIDWDYLDQLITGSVPPSNQRRSPRL